MRSIELYVAFRLFSYTRRSAGQANQFTGQLDNDNALTVFQTLMPRFNFVNKMLPSGDLITPRAISSHSEITEKDSPCYLPNEALRMG